MTTLEQQFLREYAQTEEGRRVMETLLRVLEHPGHSPQKAHGNRYGSADAIRKNVKRLGKDKEALKRMAARARKDKDKLTGGAKPKRGADDVLSRSKKQRQADIDQLSQMPLKELRKRQSLVDQQIKTAFDKKDTKALTSLQHQSDDLIAAIDKKEFGSTKKNKRKPAKLDIKDFSPLNLKKIGADGRKKLMGQINKEVKAGRVTPELKIMRQALLDSNALNSGYGF